MAASAMAHFPWLCALRFVWERGKWPWQLVMRVDGDSGKKQLFEVRNEFLATTCGGSRADVCWKSLGPLVGWPSAITYHPTYIKCMAEQHNAWPAWPNHGSIYPAETACSATITTYPRHVTGRHFSAGFFNANMRLYAVNMQPLGNSYLRLGPGLDNSSTDIKMCFISPFLGTAADTTV